MSAPRRPGLLFLLCAGSGLCYFLVSGLGLLADVGGSRLNRTPEFHLSIRLAPLLIGLCLGAALVLLYRVRGTVTGLFLRLMNCAAEHPWRFMLGGAAALILLHAILFAPFRYHGLRLPDESSADLTVEYRANRPVVVRARRGFEDYSRNYVVSRSIRRLGIRRYFELHRAPELTPPERSLCAWGLKNHPPGYHLLLAPFTAHPFLARGLSLLLYAIMIVLSYLVYRPLIGSAAAALGTAIFWGTPGNLFFIGMMTSNDLAVAIPSLGALALITNAPQPTLKRMLWAGLLLGIAWFTKYTAVLALGLACLAALVRFGPRRGLEGCLKLLAGALPIYVGWIALLSTTDTGSMQYQKYIVEMLGRVSDPAHIGRASSSARGALLDFFVYLPAEWGPPAFLIVLAALVWLLFRPRRVGRGGLLTIAFFALPFLGAMLAIPKTNYIFFAQGALFAFAALFLLRTRGTMESVLCSGAAVLYGVARVVLFGIQTT